MRQTFLPGFPQGAERVGELLSILPLENTVTYFIGSDSYFSHAADDRNSQRFVLASLMEHGHVRAVDFQRKSHA